MARWFPVVCCIVVTVILTFLVARAYTPWFSLLPPPVEGCERRHRFKRKDDEDGDENVEYTEHYVGTHWAPKCSDSHRPVMVFDDDDDDVPIPSPPKPSTKVAGGAVVVSPPLLIEEEPPPPPE